MNKQILIVGTGLIGGSLAKALRKSGFAKTIVGADQNEAALRTAIELGVIDRYSTDLTEAVAGSDIIVLAVPVRQTETVLEQLLPGLPASSIITDVGSSKAHVVAAAERVLGDSISRFVPGHPIAGREKSGVAAAETELFRDHRVILTPLNSTRQDAIELVTKMWNSVGAQTSCLSVQQHDLVLAATSHLPHVLAYATVDTLAGTDYVEEIFEFAAGGFRDFSRIASSDPVMWRDVCLTNKSAILDVLDKFEAGLAEIRQAIKTDDSEKLTKTFASAKKIRDDFIH